MRTDAKFAYFYEFLTPFFFIYIGMQVDPGFIATSLGQATILLVPAILGKLIGVSVPALRFVAKRDAVLLGLSMIPRAEIAMVVLYQCHQLDNEIIPDNVFAAVIVVSVATSILASLVLRYLLVNRIPS